MKKWGVCLALAVMLCAGPVLAATVSKGVAVIIPLETVFFKNGKIMNLSVGVGSGAYHQQGDPADVVYLVTDRGPNIDCKDDEKLIGEDMCAAGKIFPSPAFIPTIYKLQADFESGGFDVLAVLTPEG